LIDINFLLNIACDISLINYFLKKITTTILFHFLLNLSFLYQFVLLKSKYVTSSLKTNEKPLNGPNLSAETTI